jgi:hypothetical protein
LYQIAWTTTAKPLPSSWKPFVKEGKIAQFWFGPTQQQMADIKSFSAIAGFEQQNDWEYRYVRL